MKEKRNKGIVIWTIVVSAIAALLTIVFGIVISLLTGYVADEYHLLIKLSVWIGNVFVCYSLVYLFAYIVIKVKHRKNFQKGKYKFFGWVVLLLTCGFSAVLVTLLSGSFDYSYVTTFSGIAALIGIIFGIIKLIDKKRISDEKSINVTVNVEQSTNITYTRSKTKNKKRGRK